MPKPRSTSYTLSVQRRETSGQGRWREIAVWTLTTSETDMLGPLNCGLRDNYRIVINPSDTSQSPQPPPHDPGVEANMAMVTNRE
jgi:hypothetical protein